MYQEKIIDISTGEETYRPYSAEEVAEIELAIEEAKIELQKIEEAKEAKSALFARLGITEEEAKALLS